MDDQALPDKIAALEDKIAALTLAVAAQEHAARLNMHLIRKWQADQAKLDLRLSSIEAMLIDPELEGIEQVSFTPDGWKTGSK